MSPLQSFPTDFKSEAKGMEIFSLSQRRALPLPKITQGAKVIQVNANEQRDKRLLSDQIGTDDGNPPGPWHGDS